MLLQAKNTGIRLINEDSGIAMPLSLLVFLFLSFLCMSVFAIGEVVRSRTELQYKVDNAAYAAALTQADCISRIAVLNRAMAWTYVQVNRMQMDYIMNRWLSEAKKAFTQDADDCLQRYSVLSANPCTEHLLDITSLIGGKRTFEEHTDEHLYKYKSDDRFYGLSCNYENVLSSIILLTNTEQDLPSELHGIIENADSSRTAKELKKVFDLVSDGQYASIASQIENGRANLTAMQDEITSIKNMFTTRLRIAVENFTKDNTSVQFKILLGNNELREGEPIPDYFEKYQTEDDLYENYAKQVGEIDTKSWRGKNWWSSISDGIGHRYSGNFMLQWYGYYVKWVCEKDKNIHTPAVFKLRETATTCEPGINPDAEGTAWPDWWNQEIRIEPCKLKEIFFGKDGALVVAAKMPVPNLFARINLAGSIWNRFNVDWDMWCVSAARAGYRIPGNSAGQYENSKFEQVQKWNLFVDDWDAGFLPISRCWKTWNTEEQKFQGESVEASNVLSTVKTALQIDSTRTITDNSNEINKDMLH